MNDQGQEIDFSFKKDNLYREESITDLKTGSIRTLNPIKLDGSQDESRKTIFVGHTQLMSPQGMVPLQAALQADTLDAAIEKYPEAMKKALAEMIEQAKKMQEEQARMKQQEQSSIIMPGR